MTMDRKRLADLFEQAIDIAPENLSPWLIEMCGDDAALRAELERLLRADAKASRFMETPPSMILAAAATAAASADSAPSTSAAEAPRAFGVYRVVRSIGVGGMGEVWLAERFDGEFEQRVAIKQLAYPTPGLLQRFRQERQILARLEHANIARLIDGGLDPTGAPYLVMEYVEGVPITTYAQAHALDLRARLALFLRVCETVQYAHQNLIVHRDLKPPNIFVTADGTPKLLDFGIAKVLATTEEDAPTQTAARLLTPDYAAPEQFSGGAITTATDVYALGVVLYELLVGKRPARVAVDVANAGSLRTTAPSPPSAALGTTHGAIGRRALRGDVDRIVLTALAAEPQRRYASAEALAADIRSYLDGRPIAARRDSIAYRFRKYAMRNRYLLAAAVIVFAVCIVATIVSLDQARLARDEVQRAGAVRQFLAAVFQQANPDENKGQPISAQRLLEKGEQIQQRMAGQPALEADVAALLGQLYGDLGDYAHGDVLLTRALALSTDARVPDDVRARVLVNVAALEGETKGKFDASLVHARQSVSLLEAAPEHNAEDLAKAHWIIAWDLINLDDNDGAIALLLRTAPGDQAILGDRSEPVAEQWVKLGIALGKSSRYDEAAVAFDKATWIMRDIYGENSNHVAHVLNELAVMYLNAGIYSRAEEALRKAFKIHFDTLGPDHPDTLSARHNLLGAVEGSGHYAEALPQRLQLAQQVKSSTTDASPIKVANQFDAIGNDYRELGRFDEANAMSEQALALLAQTQGERSPRSITARSHFGTTLQLQGRYAESDAVFHEALAISLEHGSPTSYNACGLRQKMGQNLRLEHRYAEAIEQLHALTADACLQSLKENDQWRPVVLAALSEAQLDSGDAASANLTAETAMTYARKAFPPQHFRLGIALFAQGRAKLAAGQPADAERLLREALVVRTPPHPSDDPRVLEVKVALATSLSAQGKSDEGRSLAAEIGPLLAASRSPYIADLKARLAVH